MSYNYDVIFDSKEKAEDALEDLKVYARDLGKATLANLYDIAGLRSAYADIKKWWTEPMLKFAKIEHYVGGWAIELPAPICDRSDANGCYPSYRYRNYKPVPAPKPEPLTITINTDGLTDFEFVLSETFKRIRTITDRPVYISII